MQTGEPKGPRELREEKPRGKKDRRKWCGGHVGRVHVPVITVGWRFNVNRKCAPPPEWWYRCRAGRKTASDAWWCSHRETCETCGKILRDSWSLKPEECPDYPGVAV